MPTSTMTTLVGTGCAQPFATFSLLVE